MQTWESVSGHVLPYHRDSEQRKEGKRSERQETHRRGVRGDVSDRVPPIPEAQLHPCSGRPPISSQYLYTAQELPQASQACLKQARHASSPGLP